MSRTIRRKNVAVPKYIREANREPYDHELRWYRTPYTGRNSHSKSNKALVARFYSDNGYPVHGRPIYGEGKYYLRREVRSRFNQEVRRKILRGELDSIVLPPEHKLGDRWTWD